jgi:hypothetical protein
MLGTVRHPAARFVAAVLTLALAGDYYALCAGWMPTAEARMACCIDGTCPMHQEHAEPSGSGQQLTQAEADACCAASEPPGAASSTAPGTLAAALTAPDTAISFDLPASLAAGQAVRTSAPAPPGHVPRHVLLSVFLV